MKNQKSYEIIKQAVRNSMTVNIIKSTIEKNPDIKTDFLRSFYDGLFVSYFENEPEYKIQSLLSLLNLTARQKKVHGVSDVTILKIEFCKNLIKEINFYMNYKEQEVIKEVENFIMKLEKKLEKLLTPKKVKTSDVKELQEVQEVHEEQQAQLVESTSEKPKQIIQFEETAENIELLKKFAQICLDYTHKNVWGASKKQDEMLNLFKEKWNLTYDEIFKLSNPYYDKLVDEYYEEQKRKEKEAEEAKKALEAMKLKSSDVRMLNFAVSILIKDKQKLQFSLAQLYEESDHMEFTEKQIAINNCKVDLNNAQELITKILSLRNAGYVPQYYESKYDSEEDKQIAAEAWTNFLAKDIYNPDNKEESLANLKLIFSKLRKF